MSEHTFESLIARQGNRYRTATEFVTDVLRDAIISGAIKQGASLAQEDLGARFQVSRAPIREALRLLEAQGLVETSPHKGARVARLQEDEMVEIFEIRAALEALALQRSVPRLSQSDLASASAVLEELDAEKEINRHIDLHRRFHMTLYSRAGTRLLALINQQFDVAERYLRIEAASLDNGKETQARHHALLEACRRRDVEHAAAHLAGVASTGHELVCSLASAGRHAEKSRLE